MSEDQAADSIEKEERPTASWFWIKSSDGQASVSTTFLTIAFAATTLSYVTSMFDRIGPLTPRPFDTGACSAYFIPLLTLYFGRRWTNAKFSSESKE
jgi:hypothetical protein